MHFPWGGAGKSRESCWRRVAGHGHTRLCVVALGLELCVATCLAAMLAVVASLVEAVLSAFVCDGCIECGKGKSGGKGKDADEEKDAHVAMKS